MAPALPSPSSDIPAAYPPTRLPASHHPSSHPHHTSFVIPAAYSSFPPPIRHSRPIIRHSRPLIRHSRRLSVIPAQSPSFPRKRESTPRHSCNPIPSRIRRPALIRHLCPISVIPAKAGIHTLILDRRLLACPSFPCPRLVIPVIPTIPTISSYRHSRPPIRHSRESGNPHPGNNHTASSPTRLSIIRITGVNERRHPLVLRRLNGGRCWLLGDGGVWIPAFAGMTDDGGGNDGWGDGMTDDAAGMAVCGKGSIRSS